MCEEPAKSPRRSYEVLIRYSLVQRVPEVFVDQILAACHRCRSKSASSRVQQSKALEIEGNGRLMTRKTINAILGLASVDQTFCQELLTNPLQAVQTKHFDLS